MDFSQFEEYLKQVRALTSRQEILDFIEEQIFYSDGNIAYEEFFTGESNFYKEKYEEALEHYLEAKDVPFFQFFCYRASCVIAKERGETLQALSFAEKAMKISPEDPVTQLLFESLSKQAEEISLESQKCRSSQEAYECSVEENPSCSFNSHTGHGANSHSALEELRKLATSGLNYELGLLSSDKKNHKTSVLEQRIHAFQLTQAAMIQNYIKQTLERPKLLENALYVLNGWDFQGGSFNVNAALLTEESRKSSGGHYLRWNGKGIAINPGAGFLKNFHAQGLCIKDIDCVLVTCDNIDAYGDVKAIYELNAELNKHCNEMQMIHYYLHQKVYRELATFLKPSFKQARHTIHNLEMFLDSPDVEKIELFDGAILHYFLASPPKDGRYLASQEAPLGIRFDLSKSSHADVPTISIGYLSGMAWTQMMAHHLSSCCIILAAFGHTGLIDCAKNGQNSDSLGLHGVSSLLEEISPKLMLLTEFSGREGDVRLEVVKKIREDHIEEFSGNKPYPILLPADNGLALNLTTLEVQCSLSNFYVSINRVQVVALSESFGRLCYLSPCFSIDPLQTEPLALRGSSLDG